MSSPGLLKNNAAVFLAFVKMGTLNKVLQTSYRRSFECGGRGEEAVKLRKQWKEKHKSIVKNSTKGNITVSCLFVCLFVYGGGVNTIKHNYVLHISL